jgi:excisionase family DNA binding protein
MTNRLPDKELLRPDEVAKYLSLSRSTIYGWIQTGRLDAKKVGGSVRVKREDVVTIISPYIEAT